MARRPFFYCLLATPAHGRHGVQAMRRLLPGAMQGRPAAPARLRSLHRSGVHSCAEIQTRELEPVNTGVRRALTAM